MAETGDYIALQAYMVGTAEARKALDGIRTQFLNRFKLATTLGFGPRYLHSTGQLHKGGPDTGIFIQLVDEPERDIQVPGSDYTFGSLISAQALGDYRALRHKGRRVLRINLGTEVRRGLEVLRSAVEAMD
jgi:transaldolase/glucose-6-phosphate isomerase